MQHCYFTFVFYYVNEELCSQEKDISIVISVMLSPTLTGHLLCYPQQIAALDL